MKINNDMQTSAIKSTESQHKNYLDVLRAISCLLVVYIHVSGNILKDLIPFNSKTYYIVSFLTALAYISVPMFVMASGSVMLGKDISINKLKNKIVKLFSLFCIWLIIPIPMLIYLNPWMNFSWNTVRFIIENVFAYSYHLWYIPMLIGLYALIPVLNHIVKDKKILDYLVKCFFIIVTIITIIDVLKSFDILNLSMFIGDIRLLFPIFIGYFLLGYSTDKYDTKFNNKFFYFSILMIILISVIMPIYTDKQLQFSYRTSIVYLLLIPALFLYIKNRFNIKSKIIKNISDNSLGIYLVHLLYVNLLYFSYFKFLEIHPLALIFIETLAVFAISYVTILIIKKIPKIKFIAG